MSSCTLEAVNLSLRRRRDFALTGIDLAVGAGELLVLVGPNGSGKSTLMHCLSGLLTPTDGQVRLDGADLHRLPARARARRVGLLLQRAASAWPVSVRHLVGFGRIPHGDGQGEDAEPDGPAGKAIAHALTAMELNGLADRPVDTLSGGEQARAHLARVLAGEPHVVLADEPVAELDPVHALRVMDLLQRLARSGRAVLAIMHDLSLALRYADRIAVLAEGRLLALDTPDAIAEAGALEAAFGLRFALVRQDGLLGVVPVPPAAAGADEADAPAGVRPDAGGRAGSAPEGRAPRAAP
ncbi:MAG: ATP-binding cassette domain-containing protein [Alphaproteobacteria bacterium]|nr:ATP-binding cassette domain-containing protein [Alphaproteobacteria bacterium]